MLGGVYVDIYKDTTGLYSDEECDYDNCLTVKVSRRQLRKWVKKHFKQSLKEFLSTYTCDDTQSLFHDLRKYVKIERS